MSEDDEDTSFRLNGTERVATFGGEAWVDDLEFANYGIDFGGHHVSGLSPAQAIALATALVDHLILCGHEFEVRKTGEQDQRERLICLDNERAT